MMDAEIGQKVDPHNEYGGNVFDEMPKMTRFVYQETLVCLVFGKVVSNHTMECP